MIKLSLKKFSQSLIIMMKFWEKSLRITQEIIHETIPMKL